MRNRENLEEKIKIDYQIIHKKRIDYSIYDYILAKYKNVINEINLIKKILEYCTENDENTKLKYLRELKQLEEEKGDLFGKLKDMDVEIYGEEDKEK